MNQQIYDSLIELGFDENNKINKKLFKKAIKLDRKYPIFPKTNALEVALAWLQYRWEKIADKMTDDTPMPSWFQLFRDFGFKSTKITLPLFTQAIEHDHLKTPIVILPPQLAAKFIEDLWKELDTIQTLPHSI